MILADYIFNHKQYKQVISLYEEVRDKYISAYKVWAEHYNLPDGENYQKKKTVADNIFEIKRVDAWIRTYADIVRYKKDALLWLYDKTGKQYNNDLKYNDYKFIIDNEAELNLLHSYICIYNHLIHTQKEAVDRFLSSSSNTHSYNKILKVALNKERIIQITSILSNAHSCEKYSYAWKLFSKERSFNKIPISELETVSDEKFSIKDTFLKIYENKSSLIKLILGKDMLPVDSFEKETIEQEEEIIPLLFSELNPTEQFNANIHLDNANELKRAILNSECYGNEFDFTESYDINKFYKLRSSFDSIGVSFDHAAKKIRENESVVKSFNQEKRGKYVVFIENYLSIVTKGSELFIAVEQYNEEKEQRDKAKSIKRGNKMGFNAMYNCIDLDTCPISVIIEIINNKSKISEKNYELEEKERIKAEEEKKRHEISILHSCVEKWSTLYCGLKYSYLVNYFPTTCNFEVSDSEWNDRWLIWNFKNTPGKTTPQHHLEALKNIIPRLVYQLEKTFGIHLHKLTLVCIPASSQEKTIARYKEFSKILCNETGMKNAYEHMNLISSSSEKKFGGSGIDTNNVSFETGYFRGKYILLFDDVITKGESMLKFKIKMEELGATVVGGFSIGKTKHEHI